MSAIIGSLGSSASHSVSANPESDIAPDDVAQRAPQIGEERRLAQGPALKLVLGMRAVARLQRRYASPIVESDTPDRSANA